jgi:hypothetical protein
LAFLLVVVVSMFSREEGIHQRLKDKLVGARNFQEDALAPTLGTSLRYFGYSGHWAFPDGKPPQLDADGKSIDGRPWYDGVEFVVSPEVTSSSPPGVAGRDAVRAFADGTSVSRLLFFGDSNMQRLVLATVGKHPTLKLVTSKKLQSAEWRCQVPEYMGFERSARWESPEEVFHELGTVGPHKYGLENHWCTDCSTCETQRYEQQVGGGNYQLTSLEMLPMEYALDVEVQTVRGRTTQESAWAFVLDNYVKEDVMCIFNAGAHDAFFIHASLLEVSEYTENVRKDLVALSEICSRVVWVGLADSRGGKPQTHGRLREMNDAVKEMWWKEFEGLRREENNVFFLDVFEITTPETSVLAGEGEGGDSGETFDLHVDNIHLHPPFYDLVAEAFT